MFGSPYDKALAEGYGFGVISTLIILIFGMIVCCICNRFKLCRKEKGGKKIEYENVDLSDDEQINVDK